MRRHHDAAIESNQLQMQSAWCVQLQKQAADHEAMRICNACKNIVSGGVQREAYACCEQFRCILRSLASDRSGKRDKIDST